MFRTIVSVSALVLTLALAGVAAAQDHRARDAASTAPDTSYDFDDEAVEGGRYSPDGQRVLGNGRVVHRTLIRPRVHFVPELLKSVERL